MVLNDSFCIIILICLMPGLVTSAGYFIGFGACCNNYQRPTDFLMASPFCHEEGRKCVCKNESLALSTCGLNVPGIFMAFDDCCNGDDPYGLAYGCEYLEGVCGCPKSKKKYIPYCEYTNTTNTNIKEIYKARSDPLPNQTISVTTRPAFNAKSTCCSTRFGYERDLLRIGAKYCFLQYDRNCMCHDVWEANNCRTDESALYQVKEDCCNGKDMTGFYNNCGYYAGVCACPVRWASNLQSCAIPDNVTEEDTQLMTTTTFPLLTTTTSAPTNTTTQRPSTTTQPPTTTTPRPITTKPRPATTATPPVTTTPRPSTTTPRPSTTTSRPITTTTRPSTTTPRPATTTPRPSTTTPRPTATTPRPTTTTQRSTTTTPPPTTCNLVDTTNVATTSKPFASTSVPTENSTPSPTPPPSPSPSIQPCRKSGKADIVLLMDASTSIGETNWYRQVKFADEITQAFNVGPNDVRFAAVIFNSETVKIFDLKTYMDHRSISKALLGIQYPSRSGTYTDLALRVIRKRNMFSSEAGGRDNAKDIVIVMTDGQSYEPSETKWQAQKLKDLGVTLISVGIGSEISRDELLGIASKPDYVLLSGGYSHLESIKSNLINVTCDSA